MAPPLSSLVAIATGIIGAGWASGAIASISLVGIPAAKSVPSATVQVWTQLFAQGFAIMPKFASTVGVSYLFAAWDDSRRNGSSWKGYAGAALLAVAIVPYTIAFMSSTNARLHAAAAGAEVGAAEVNELVNRWAALNLGRAVLPLASAVTGLVTFLGTLI